MIVDTSFVIALLDPTDALHDDARRWFQQHRPLSIQQPALTETLQATYYQTRKRAGFQSAKKQERKALDIMRNTFRFHAVPVQDIEFAMEIYLKYPELSFVDACGVADARETGGLLTFDKDQQTLAEKP